MRRSRWNKVIWLWGLLAVLLSADVYSNMAGGAASLFDENTSMEASGRFHIEFNIETAGIKTAGIKTTEKGSERENILVQEADAALDDQEMIYERKEIALTFDDGPHSVYTVKLLDGLKERGVHASFFVIGQNIEGNEDVLLRMKEEGHLIGNHSQNHMQLTKGNAEAVCEQITTANQKIYEVTGQMPSYVRPPFGSWSEELECMVPMTVALWDIDPLDWKTQNTSKIVSHVVQHADEGEIILLHDVYETSVEAALEIVDRLSEKGYNFVTVDELLIE